MIPLRTSFESTPTFRSSRHSLSNFSGVSLLSMLHGKKRARGREEGRKEGGEREESQRNYTSSSSACLRRSAPSPRWIGNILAHQRPGWAASRVELLTLQRAPPQSSPARTRARMPIPKFTKFTEMSKVVIYFDDKTGCLFGLKRGYFAVTNFQQCEM